MSPSFPSPPWLKGLLFYIPYRQWEREKKTKQKQNKVSPVYQERGVLALENMICELLVFFLKRYGGTHGDVGDACIAGDVGLGQVNKITNKE